MKYKEGQNIRFKQDNQDMEGELSRVYPNSVDIIDVIVFDREHDDFHRDFSREVELTEILN